MEEEKLLHQIKKFEKEQKLDDDLILGLPIWRLVRYHTRLSYINKKTGYIAGSTKVQKVGTPKPQILSNFWRFVGKENLNIFYPFHRLTNIEGIYLDKFVDPIISLSSIDKGNYIILDPPHFVGDYKRLHKDHSISNEGRTLSRQLLKYWFKIVTPFVYGKKLRLIYIKCKEYFLLDEKTLNNYYEIISGFLGSYYYYLIWFKILKPRRVFVVFREAYFPQIAACKRLKIPVAEFQHGITIGNTVSFTGEYDNRIDPDYFLVFGDYWKGPQFGMPLDRIFNIGWAYCKYLEKSLAKNVEMHHNDVLVISSPEISDAILDALQELSKFDGDYRFDIRLHPCESYSELQQKKLKLIPKAKVVDNKIDSAIVLPTYKFVVGENSSVLYEALSVGCKVGMLNLCGLSPAIDLPGIKENFFVINNCSDFKRFMSDETKQSRTKAEFYSEFDSKRFMEFINNKM